MTAHRIGITSVITGLIMTSLVAVSVAQTAPPASADPHELQSPSSLDQQIKRQIERKLTEEDALHSVRVTVHWQMVTLRGIVPSLWAKDKAIKQAASVDNVHSVLSELMIAARESDRDIAEEVVERVRRYVYYSIFDNITVSVDHGVVTLAGQLREGVGRKDLVRIVSRVPGVTAVDDQIEVLPAGDDRVRARVAAQIYGHPQFQKYTFYAKPPISIIVHQGDVRLAGVVNSPLEKQLAKHLALHTFGVLTVTNDLQIEGQATDR